MDQTHGTTCHGHVVDGEPDVETLFAEAGEDCPEELGQSLTARVRTHHLSVCVVHKDNRKNKQWLMVKVTSTRKNCIFNIDSVLSSECEPYDQDIARTCRELETYDRFLIWYEYVQPRGLDLVESKSKKKAKRQKRPPNK